MHRVLVLGGGKIGALIAGLLADAAPQLGAWNRHGSDKSISGRIVVEGKAGRQRSRAGEFR
jgi:prephenate dehydrogenase